MVGSYRGLVLLGSVLILASLLMPYEVLVVGPSRDPEPGVPLAGWIGAAGAVVATVLVFFSRFHLVRVLGSLSVCVAPALLQDDILKVFGKRPYMYRTIGPGVWVLLIGTVLVVVGFALLHNEYNRQKRRSAGPAAWAPPSP
jgi:hypothetical protein